MDVPTREDFFKIAADEALARSDERLEGRRLSVEQIYTEGSDANILLAGMSAMADEAMRVSLKRVCDVNPSTARNLALDRAIAERTTGKMPRLEASPSVGVVQCGRNLTISSDALTIPAGTNIRTKTGQTVRTVFPLAFAAGFAGPVSVRAQSIQTGPSGNVLAGEVQGFVSPIQGVTVENAERFAGGDNAESDERYFARFQRFYQAIGKGTLAAIEFGAMQVRGVRQANAFNLLEEDGQPSGRIFLYISDASGAGNSALAADVQLVMDDWAAGGVPVIVIGAVPVVVPVSIRPLFETGIDSTVSFETFRKRLVSRQNAKGPNLRFERSLVESVGRSTPGMIVQDDFVAEPLGDVIPEAGETLRVDTSSITVAT